MAKKYYQVQLAQLVRQIANVIVVIDDSNKSFADTPEEILDEAFYVSDGTEFDIDPDWGTESGEHTLVGEITKEQAESTDHGLKIIDLTK